MKYRVRIRFSAPWVHLHSKQRPPWVLLTPLYQWMERTERRWQKTDGGWVRRAL